MNLPDRMVGGGLLLLTMDKSYYRRRVCLCFVCVCVYDDLGMYNL